MADDTDDDVKEPSRLSRGLKAAGKSVRESGQRMSEAAYSQAASRENEPSPNSGPPKVQSYRKGGKVRKTGPARLHRGEKLIGRKKKIRRASGRY